jgi:hypothetical protein
MKQAKKITLLNECRQLMTKRMRVLITAMLNEVDDTLMSMAEQDGTALNDLDCYEALREIRIKRTEIKLRFERRLINLFEKKIKQLQGSEAKKSCANEKTNGNFAFSNHGMHSSVSVEKSADEARKKCARSLLELDNKFSLLLENSETTNPLEPEIIFEAFRESCCDIKSGSEVRLIMFNIFEKRINHELSDAYQEISEVISSEYDKQHNNSENKKINTNSQAEDESNRSMLKYKMIILIEKRMEGRNTPHFVRYFLLKYWRLFLEETCIKYSENSIAWNAARQTMDDLLDSVDTMSTIYDRQKQVQLLPSLLFRLLNGMKIISMHELEIELFFKQLKASQLESLNTENNVFFENIANEIEQSISKYELES